MIEVTVSRTVRTPEYQVFSSLVRVNNFDKLSPQSAIAATQIAFGSRGGRVMGDDGYGYNVYPNSVRKIYD